LGPLAELASDLDSFNIEVPRARNGGTSVLKLSRSEGPGGSTARVYVLPFLPEDGRRSSFRNVILLKYRRWIKSKRTLLRINFFV
jgi:hypothetical protein